MCDGGGCGACKEGVVLLTDCPGRIAEQAASVIELAEIAEKGTWPLAGGLLEQPAKFVALARIVWAEMRSSRSGER